MSLLKTEEYNLSFGKLSKSDQAKVLNYERNIEVHGTKDRPRPIYRTRYKNIYILRVGTSVRIILKIYENDITLLYVSLHDNALDWLKNSSLEKDEDKEDEDDWQKTCPRFIAYFDIMGFKNMMKTRNLSDVFNDFSNLILANVQDNRRSQIDFYIYSDLIVIITKDGSQYSLKQLLEASIKITDQILSLKWGVSGSIAKGEVSYDRKNHVIMGKPIVEAYLMQEDVEFYGIAICDSAVKDIEAYIVDVKSKKLTEHLGDLLKEERIHFKDGFYSQYHLRWFDYKYDDLGPNHPYYIRRRDNSNNIKSILEEIKSETKGRAKRYIENTLELIS